MSGPSSPVRPGPASELSQSSEDLSATRPPTQVGLLPALELSINVGVSAGMRKQRFQSGLQIR